MALAGWLWVATHHAGDLVRYAPERAATVVALPHWLDGDWRQLPAQRSDMEGEAGEPFSLQWAGGPDAITQVLDTAGWRAPAPWNASTVLAWLLPHPDIAALPVVPKFNQGLSPILTFVRVLGPGRRLVVRLWRSNYATSVHGEQAPIVLGTVTAETLANLAGVLSMVRTAHDTATPLHALAASLAPDSFHSVLRPDSSAVLLVWPWR